MPAKLSPEWNRIKTLGEKKRIVYQELRRMANNGIGPSAATFEADEQKPDWLPSAQSILKEFGFKGNGGWPALVEDSGLKRAGNPAQQHHNNKHNSHMHNSEAIILPAGMAPKPSHLGRLCVRHSSRCEPFTYWCPVSYKYIETRRYFGGHFELSGT